MTQSNGRNIIKVNATSDSSNIQISVPNTKQTISATNNRAQYFADLAKKYRDEAKEHRDSAKYYSEQNTNVSIEYIENIRSILESKIEEKQPSGEYALSSEVPRKVSDLENDSLLVNQIELSNAIEEVRLPAQEDSAGKFLSTDGQSASWKGISSFGLFDIKISDRLLTALESIGWALQGTYVYKSTYPDFYTKCFEEKAAAVAEEMSLSGNALTVYRCENGHIYYDIADKTKVDTHFQTTGMAWFYGIDVENERIFLPRKNLYNARPSSTLPVMGNGLTLGLNDVTNGNCGLRMLNAYFCPHADGYGVSAGTKITTNGGFKEGYTYGVTTDSSKSGIVADSAALFSEDTQSYLYICVGTSFVNESLIDVANITSEINFLDSEKVNTDLSNCTQPYIKETYRNGNSWYRLWSDNWCEQGSLSGYPATITLLKSYSDVNWNVVATISTNATRAQYENITCTEKTESSFYLDQAGRGVSNSAYWYAFGYIA